MSLNLRLDAPPSSRYNLPARFVNNRSKLLARAIVFKEKDKCPHIQSANTQRAAATCAARMTHCRLTT